MYDHGFWLRFCSFEPEAAAARLCSRRSGLWLANEREVWEYQGLWHICIKPFFILPLGSIVLLGGESWRSLKNPHFPLAQRWLGWGLSLVFRGKKWRDHNHERIERSFSQSYFQSFTILLLLSSLQFSSSPFLYANGSKVLKRKVQ